MEGTYLEAAPSIGGCVLWEIKSLEIEGDTFFVVFGYETQRISVVADVAFEGAVAWFCGVHIDGMGANKAGMATLMLLVRWALRVLDVDEIRIAGATRTSGAKPGRRPPVLAFGRDGSRRIGI